MCKLISSKRCSLICTAHNPVRKKKVHYAIEDDEAIVIANFPSRMMLSNRPGDDIRVPPKDEEELKLERLVFGDLEGIENNLKRLDNLYDYSSEDLEEKYLDESEFESNSDDEIENAQDDELFFIDDGVSESKAEDDVMEIDIESGDNSSDDDSENSENAWEDSDDENLIVSLTSSDKLKKLRRSELEGTLSGKAYAMRLRAQFEKIYPKPDWVERLDEEIESDSENSLSDKEEAPEGSNPSDIGSLRKFLESNEKFVITKQLKLLSPSKISITRLVDANRARPSKSAIQSLSFHPSRPLLLTGGFDRTLRIYHIDGKSNELVTSLYLKNCPVAKCFFSSLQIHDNESLVFAAGRRRYLTKWDVSTGEIEKISRMYGQERFQKSMENFKISPKGSYIGLVGSSGWCNLLDGKTGRFLRGFKIEGTIVDFVFARDESFLLVANSSGEVWEYELNISTIDKERTDSKNFTSIIRKWQDDSGVGVTHISLGGPQNRWLAIGTNNGIVNIYDRNTFSSDGNPKPIKAVENLVTSISTLQFSSDGQILVISSRAKRDALRLVHLPTCTVFSNWPTSGTPLGKVTAVSFSPNNEFLAIGNESGKVTLWRLNHY